MPDREYDEDDRPRRRRRDDDFDDRPRKAGGSGLVIALVVGGVLLLLLCVGGGLALLLIPAVTKVREAASRTQDQNNLKLLVIGMHNQSDATGAWAAPYARDGQGNVQTGLSWRVGLLPYVEQEPLYRSFDLTQPWDSARNRPFSDTPVRVFQTPFDEAPGTQTPYRVFVGGGALFNEDGKPIRLTDVKDGTANTIMIVMAADEVAWAQPRELRYSATAPLPALGHKKLPGGANVAMADGSVRFLRSDTPEHVVRALITRAGGEEVPPGW